VVQAAELLQDLGVVRVGLQHAVVGILGRVVLLLLLVDVADLEPDVDLRQRPRRVGEDVLEALEVSG